MRKVSNKVTIKRYKHPRYSWRVTYPDGDERKDKYFKNKTGKDGAEKWADAKQKEIDAHGTKHEAITSAELRAVHSFREAIAELPEYAQETSLFDVVKNYIQGIENRYKSIACREVADKLINTLQAKGRSERHYKGTKNRLARFNENYGDRLACDITAELIDEFISELNVAGKTQENYRLALNRMFKYAVKIKAAPTNPVEDVEKPTITPGETGVLTPKQLARLLECADDNTLPGIVISFFAGLRTSEIDELDWSKIDLEEQTIEVIAKDAKTAKRRIVPIRDNLKEWLAPHARHEGRVTVAPRRWMDDRKKASIAAGIEKWVNNAGRHSYTSYLLALEGDSGKLATYLGHPNPQLLHQHYKQLVTKKAAETYWNIRPAKNRKITNIKSA
jgi:integrase